MTDVTTNQLLEDELSKKNPMFRNLVQQHQKFEERLNELAGLTYPNDEELLEEATLKKKKLSVKDEIYSMLEQHSVLH